MLEVRDVERSSIGDRQVLVRVHASSITAGDVLMLGAPWFATRVYWGLFAPRRHELGFDVSGTNSNGIPDECETVNYCTSASSASGCNATLSAPGIPSATDSSGFMLEANNVEGAKSGMFFYGFNGRQAAPWGSRFQCVVPPVRRGGLFPPPIGSTVGSCDGSFAQDLNASWCPTCPKPAHNPGAGTVMQGQFWYRDSMSTGGKSTSLSDAIEFTVGP